MNQMHLRLVTGLLAALGLVSALAIAVQGVARAEQPGEKAMARHHGPGFGLYQRHCSGCHGSTGRGDGSTARFLEVPPPDLTELSATNSGEFPAEHAYQIIEGRNEGQVPGRRAMPLWGYAFTADSTDQHRGEVARQRINDLVSYLETIQSVEQAEP